MNSMKSALAMFVFLVVGIGTGLMVRVGIGATFEPGADVQWFDNSLVGAAAGAPVVLFDQETCIHCNTAIDGQDILSSREAIATDETRLIAEHLDLHTVPMLLVNGDQITYVDTLQWDSPPRVAALH